MNYDFERSKTAWESAFNSGSRDERIARSLTVADFFNYLASKRDAESIPFREDPFAAELVRACGLDAVSDVLDVGCGDGDASLTFAEKCRSVTAIDMCSETLRIAKRRAQLARLQNINFFKSLWETFDTTSRFDLCYSSMCGGICDYDELIRFERYSRKYCALVTIGNSQASSARHRLRRAVTPVPLPGLMAEGIHLFNLLYAMGRCPNVIQSRSQSLLRLPIDEAVERYLLYFGAYGYTDPESKNRIREHISAESQDGFWIETSDTTTMLVYWQAPEARGI